MSKQSVSMVVVLGVICIVASLLLGGVNMITKDKIEAIAYEKLQKAMADIIPGATFEEVSLADDAKVNALYKAVDASVNTVGACAQVASPGFAADIVLIVGVDASGKIIGVRISSMSETAGLGSKTNDAKWLAQFEALSGTINLVKGKKTADTDVVAVSGATVSSTAVKDGVQTALDAATAYLGGANN